MRGKRLGANWQGLYQNALKAACTIKQTISAQLSFSFLALSTWKWYGTLKSQSPPSNNTLPATTSYFLIIQKEFHQLAMKQLNIYAYRSHSTTSFSFCCWCWECMCINLRANMCIHLYLFVEQMILPVSRGQRLTLSIFFLIF